MDALAEAKIADIVQESVKDLGMQLAKARDNLIRVKKKSFFIGAVGTYLYQVAILLSVS